MTGKFTLKVEGDAYTDAVATADKFIETVGHPHSLASKS